MTDVKGVIRDVKLTNFIANSTWSTKKLEKASRGLYQAMVVPESTLGGGFVPRIIKEIKKEKHKYL